MQVLQYFYRPQTKFAQVMFSQVFVCPEGSGLCRGVGFLSEGSLSRDVSVPGGSLSRGVFVQGSLSRGVSVWGPTCVYFCRGSLSSCPEVSSVQGVSVQKGVSVQEVSVQEGGSLSRKVGLCEEEFPPDGREQAVRIQLECIFVRNATSWQCCTDYFENNFHISSYQN